MAGKPAVGGAAAVGAAAARASTCNARAVAGDPALAVSVATAGTLALDKPAVVVYGGGHVGHINNKQEKGDARRNIMV